MSLNIEIFKTRALTALIFVLIMLAGIFISKWSFLLLFFIIMAGCLYEFIKIIRKIYGKNYLFYLPLAVIYIVLPVLMMMDMGINLVFFTKDHLHTYEFSYSPLIPFAIIFSIWINDTMAYLVGSFIGKTPFSSISPKKTWEGTMGGILLCMISIALLGNYVAAAKNLAGWQHWFHIAAICAVFGTAGDLLESKLKRMANIKDSGNFMPGHGGFLDRFDSLLIATPFVWIYIKLLF